MNTKKNILILLTVTMLCGCSTYRKKFKNKKVANIGYFADNTIAMLSNLNLHLNREDTLLVRRFIDMSAPEEMRVTLLSEELKVSLGNIVRYSIEIVNIAESDLAVTNKIMAYADYLVTFRDDVVYSREIDFEVFDHTIEEVCQQTKFIEGLRKAQPLLNSSIMAGALQIDQLIDAVEDLSLKVDQRIDEEYADIIRYRTKLEREKFDILSAFEIIYDAYRKDEPELSDLRDSGVIWTPEIIPEGRPTRDDLEKIGKHLASRMEALARVQEEMKPNWDDYLATHRELDSIVDKTILSAQHSRIIMLTWVRAHQNMSSGIVSEAEWFDIGATTKSLIKSAPGAIL
jgi:hypothetical protein